MVEKVILHMRPHAHYLWCIRPTSSYGWLSHTCQINSHRLRVKSLRLHVKNFHGLQFFVPVGTPIGSEFFVVVLFIGCWQWCQYSWLSLTKVLWFPYKVHHSSARSANSPCRAHGNDTSLYPSAPIWEALRYLHWRTVWFYTYIPSRTKMTLN